MINIYLIKYTDLQKAKESILSKYSQVKGETYTIEYLPSGEPRLVSSSRQKEYVSISHTKELLAMAFSDENIGIDVERADREVSPQICESIEKWTRIEAYAKWTGKGLSKEVVYGGLPEEIIKTVLQEEYVISICSHSQQTEIFDLT